VTQLVGRNSFKANEAVTDINDDDLDTTVSKHDETVRAAG